MPVKSYLAMSVQGRKSFLKNAIDDIRECETVASDNKDVLVVITETASEDEDKVLLKRLNGLKDLQLLTLVSAFSNENNKHNE